MFDPERKPRLPGGVENILRAREDYFDPKIGEDEDGFSLQDAEALGWNVDLFHATKHYPGRGLIEVHAGRDVLDSNEGRYGVLKAVYDFELGEHQRAQGRARETCVRLVRAQRQKLQALSAANAAREEAPTFARDSEGEWVELSDEEWVAHDAANKRMGEEHRKAIGHLRQANVYLEEMCAFSRLELPLGFLDYLNETKPLDAARKERYERTDPQSKARGQ